MAATFILSRAELTFWDTFKISQDIFKTSPGYQVFLKCMKKGTQILENQNYKWPSTDDAKESSILKREMRVYSTLASVPHTLPVVKDRCQETRETFAFNITNGLRIYNTAVQLWFLFAISDPKELKKKTQKKNVCSRNKDEVNGGKKKIYSTY